MVKYNTEHLVFLRARMRKSGLPNKFFAKKLKIQESNLSAYLSGDKECPLKVEVGIRIILKVWESSENKINKLIGEKENGK